MKGAEMRVDLPAEKHFENVSRVVGEEVDSRIAAAEPSRQKVDRERKTVHFREQRDEKRGKRAERAPVPPGPRRSEAECEDDEDNGIDDDQRLQAVCLFNDHVYLL
jgi:hypothetical protein